MNDSEYEKLVEYEQEAKESLAKSERADDLGFMMFWLGQAQVYATLSLAAAGRAGINAE